MILATIALRLVFTIGLSWTLTGCASSSPQFDGGGSPQRIGAAPASAPPVTGPRGRTLIDSGGKFLPAIMYDESRDVFRTWYHGPGTVGRIDVLHRESSDAIRWGPPKTVHSGDEWGTGIVRNGNRYRWLFYHINPNLDVQGMYSAESADGLVWSPFKGPLLNASSGVGDIIDLFWDPVRGRWGGFVKLYAQPREFGNDPKQASVRRLTGTGPSRSS